MANKMHNVIIMETCINPNLAQCWKVSDIFTNNTDIL